MYCNMVEELYGRHEVGYIIVSKYSTHYIHTSKVFCESCPSITAFFKTAFWALSYFKTFEQQWRETLCYQMTSSDNIANK